MSTQKSKVKVVIGPVRLSYVHILSPFRFPSEPEGSERYMLSALIDKRDANTINKVQAAINQVISENAAFLGGVGGNPPSILPNNYPLKDGDTDPNRAADPEYNGMFYLNAKSGIERQPGIVDCENHAVNNPNAVYSGVFARVSVTFYPYNTSGNRGIGCGLNNVQVLGYGDRLSGGSSAEEDFNDDFTDPNAKVIPATGFSPQGFPAVDSGVQQYPGQQPAQQGQWGAVPSQPAPGFPPAQPNQPAPGFPPAQPNQPAPGFPPAQPNQPAPGFPPAQPNQPAPGFPPAQPNQPAPGFPPAQHQPEPAQPFNPAPKPGFPF